MMKYFEKIFGYQRVVINENERGLALSNGRFLGILVPGKHMLRNERNGLVVELHSLARLEFLSPYRDTFMRVRPDLAAEHLTEVRTGADEVALVYRDGRLHTVLKPEQLAVYWTAAGAWSVERIDVSDALVVPRRLVSRLRTLLASSTLVVDVPDSHVAILSIDGDSVSVLEPGAHMFWQIGPKLVVKLVDMRRQSLDVNGQEVLTRDRVSIRVNLAADYRISDPLTAARAAKDHDETLYRALQYAFRKTLGTKTLDQILEEKVTVDAEVAKTLRLEMSAIGIEVGEIALKDVILPGDMRDILNQVVTAEKEAEANVIRRREETNATRSLLNTAKVMAENPVMLRLKELEALEKIAGKVERLTVHNGTSGLMNEIVNLRD